MSYASSSKNADAYYGKGISVGSKYPKNTWFNIENTNTGNNKTPVNLFETLNNIVLGYFDLCSGLELDAVLPFSK